MADPFELFVGDRSPSIEDTISIGGVDQNVSSLTVTFSMLARDTQTLVIDHAAVVKPNGGTDGVVRYDWAALDVATAGLFDAWWEVTLSTGVRQSKSAGEILVKSHTPAVNLDLCSTADVRSALKITNANLDDLIGTMIPAASAAIQKRYQRQFAPAGVQTYTFRVTRPYISLAPYDLQYAITPTLTLDPSGIATALLSSDFKLSLPHDGSATVGSLELRRTLNSYWVQSQRDYGFTELSVAGTWGFPAIPDDVRRAAVITASAWIDRGAESYGQPNMTNDGPNPYPARPETWAIPTAAHTLLQQYERLVVV